MTQSSYRQVLFDSAPKYSEQLTSERWPGDKERAVLAWGSELGPHHPHNAGYGGPQACNHRAGKADTGVSSSAGDRVSRDAVEAQ